MTIEAKISQLGFKLPPPPKPAAAYVPAAKVGNLVFTAGMLPILEGRAAFFGKVGKELTLEEAGHAAELALLNGLAAIKGLVGDLDKVARIVKLSGYVNSAPGFTEQHKVLNYASEILIKVFDGLGHHARIAVGMAELPLNVCIELDLVVEVYP
jgi:enamine deaminase RidA (YjgF/YER057c/UK114 family)